MDYYRTKAYLIGFILCSFSSHTFSYGVITEEDLLAEIDYVSGVTHLRQDLEQVPAAVTIIDRRTIESSTAVDLVDLFRLVPGFQVYSVHANRTGVTYHAPGGEYSRRLEVKIDGRSVYESFYSSVEWNTLGVDLDDIEYIEVVRGSNAPADGSNAFLASINIVTRSPLTDKGTQVNFSYGNSSRSVQRAKLTHVSQFGDLASRATLAMKNNNGFESFSGSYLGKPTQIPIDDGAETVTARYHGLWTPTASDTIDFQLGIGETQTAIGYEEYFDRTWDNTYQHLSWKHISNDWSDIELIFYHNSLDFIDEAQGITLSGLINNFPISEPLKSFLEAEPNQNQWIEDPEYFQYSDRWDAEVRSNFYNWDNVRLNVGVASRYDSVKSKQAFSNKDEVSQKTNRGFSNIEWTVNDKWTLNYGQIIEKPSGKASGSSYRVAANYQSSPRHMFRFASNSSYRSPSILESNQNSLYDYNGEVINLAVRADSEINNERLISREIGYIGTSPEHHLMLDVRIFDENFSEIIGQRREPYRSLTQDRVNIIDNTDTFQLKGIEWQLKYRPTHKLLIDLNQTYLEIEGNSLYANLPSGDIYKSHKNSAPKDMFNVLLNYQATSDWYLSASYHYKSAYDPSIKGSDAKLGKSFSRLDLKTAKRWVAGNNWIELSFVAQNLGDDYADHYFYNIFESKYILGIKVGSN
jgi:iron complex outermembrane receptor protein